MRKPVNSEIDLIRAIYARNNDLLLEAKKAPVKTILTPEQIASMKNRGIGVSSTGSGDATPTEISDRVAAAKAAAVTNPVVPTVAATPTPVMPPKSEEDLADEAEMAAWRRQNPSVIADLRNDIEAAKPIKRTIGLQDVLDDAGEVVAVTKTKGTPKAKKNVDTTVKIGAPVAQEEPKEKKLLDTLFKKADKNKNGSVTKQEFSKLLDTKVPNPITPTVSTQDEYPMDEPDVAPLTPEEISQTKSIVQGAEGGFSSTSRGKRVPVIQASAYASPEDSETSARPIIAASNNVRWPFSKEGYVGSSYTSPAPVEVKPKTPSLDLDPYRNSTKKSDALTPQIRNADGSLSPQFPLIRNGSPEWLAWNKIKDQKRIDAGLPLTIRKSKEKSEKTNTERGFDAQGNKFIQGMTDVHRDENNNPITSERFPQGIEQSNVGLHFYPNNPTARFHLDSLIAKASPGSVRNRNAKPKDEVLGVGGGENSFFVPHLPLGQYDRGTGEIIAAPHSENINLIDPSTKEHSDYLASLVKPVVTTAPSQEISDSQESGTLGDDPAKYYTNPGSIPLEKQKRRMGYSPVSRADAAVKLSQALSDVTSLRQNKDTGYVNW